jgi:hypothetical protein
VYQCLERFSGIIGQDPSIISQSNWLHVVIFQFGFIKLEVYSTYSSRLNSNFREVLNFHQLFLNLNQLFL